MSSTSNPPENEVTLKDITKLLLEIAIPFLVQQIFEDIYAVPLILTGVVLVVLSLVMFKPRWKKLASIATIFAVLLGLGLYTYFTSRPTFSLNFLNIPYKEKDAYYVTDSMIRAKGDLSPYPSFTLSPMELEIVPHYSGKERFGKVVLRISGNSQTKDYPLWAGFDSSAQSTTISLPLPDIIALSGIKVNYSEVDTSLALEGKPYQDASLSFQVIQLSNPAKPFKNEKKITVKNSPWIQTIREVGRNGAIMVDYSLKNLGAEAKFYCRMSIAKVIGVGANNHDFWSGAELFNDGPDCTPFVLKTGEVYKTSFSLDQEAIGKDFERGRYVLELYSYAERSDLQLANNSSYATSMDMWVIGKDAQVRTFVICNDHGKTCDQSMTFPVEQGSIKTFAYDSHEQTQNGSTYFVVSSRPVANRIANHYRLDYSIDPQKEGWIGFALVFQGPVDVSAYNAIQFKMKLDNRAFPVWVQCSSTDGNQETNKRILVGDDKYGAKSSDEQTVVIPLSAFPEIDWKSVSAVNFVIDNYMVPDAELHELQISDLEFIRQ